MREKSLLLNKKGGKVGFWTKVDKVNFDSVFDKNNPKVVKEKVSKKIKYE